MRFLDPVTALPSAIGIDAKAPKAEQLEAEKFVEFVMSTQGQKIMQSGDPTGDSLYWPVLHGRKPAAGAARRCPRSRPRTSTPTPGGPARTRSTPGSPTTSLNNRGLE